MKKTPATAKKEPVSVSKAASSLDDASLAYYRQSPCGKLEVVATKPLVTSYDLSLAYSPGVASACARIVADPGESAFLTARGNLVGIITNGSAVLGLGNIGALAAKPVMEGKAVLFKRFAGINAFDVEIDCSDPEQLCRTIKALEPTFGGINLEDIKSPECFYIESRLSQEMNIPVFHDDQHGTAIVVGAAMINSLHLIGKNIEDLRLVAVGAGAAGIACLNLLCEMGLRRENTVVFDVNGVINRSREHELSEFVKPYATDADVRTLAEALDGADVFLGLSAGGVLKPELLRAMAADPIVFALANPDPEIMPDLAKKIRPDCIVATGRSDFPNQINNVLCYPFIFRGALDVGATKITPNMKIACARCISQLAREPVDEAVTRAYAGQQIKFGRQSLLPKPFDPRLITTVAPVVAESAMSAGVATNPIEDMDAYRRTLARFSGSRTNALMDRFREPDSTTLRRVVFADGEDPRVLQTAQTMIREKIARPVLIGRRNVIKVYCARHGFDLHSDDDYDIVDPQKDQRYREYWETYRSMRARNGVSPLTARTEMRTDTTLIGAMLVKLGAGDVLICGLIGEFKHHLQRIKTIIGLKPGYRDCVAVSAALLKDHSIFVADTQINNNPNAQELVDIALLSASVVKQFGLEPNIALLSHSNFGSSRTAEAMKAREAVALLHKNHPTIKVEGEIDAELALDEAKRQALLPESILHGRANLLIMPNIDAASISFQLLKMTAAEHNVIESLLEGPALPCHVLHPASTARGMLNFVLYNCHSLGLSPALANSVQ
ncbi:MAG: NADP-dependent malic enzyme [Gammaproteobacteria bacterium]|nr:NADP-dependent malic enzyme [Gammaproteobacteria bacterium]